jgi:hypothetical protein
LRNTLRLKRQVLLNVLLLAIAALLWWYFEVLPHRPDEVPKAAIPVLVMGGYDWAYCWVDKRENVDRCKIFNRGGDVLFDEIFLPYRGGKPVPAADLKIKRDQGVSGGQWIELENGVILVPKSRHDRVREIIDRRLKNAAR